MSSRKFLAELIQNHAKENWWKPDLFDKHVKNKMPNNLRILEPPPPEVSNYNCFMYALKLNKFDDVRDEAKGFIYDTYVSELIKKNKLKVTDSPSQSDLVVYHSSKTDEELLSHIGIIKDDRIISKWSWGPLLEHDIWDVPDFYGDDIFYLKAISKEESYNLYQRYKSFNKLSKD